jgi:hypothetical protein
MRNKCQLAAIAVAFSLNAYAVAKLEVIHGDAPGEGFNDPTPAAPVGGNPGTTIGQQRRIAFRHAADLWGQTLTSTQVIRVVAFFEPLACSQNSAALGGAAPWVSLADVPGVKSNTWYPIALAEKLAGRDLGTDLPPEIGNFEIIAVFNSRLGQPDCLAGGGWYYGLNTNTPAGTINLVETVLHELAHGLGFTVSPTSSAGLRSELPSVWEEFMRDTSTGKRWLDMTDAERAASAQNTNNLIWTGLHTTLHAYTVLGFRSELWALGPEPVRGIHEVQPAAFGPPLTHSGVHDLLTPAIDTGGVSPIDGCEPFSTRPRDSVRGRIALVDRGTCAFTVKVKNAQLAGAVGVVVANNVPNGLPSMGGTDPTIFIPSVGITQSLGQAIRSLSRTLPVSMRLSFLIRAGTTAGFVRLYAPNPVEPGSSVSHWDTSLRPDQLMEPFARPEVGFALKPSQDLTFSLLQDLGW